MHILLSVVLALFSILFPLSSAFAQSFFEPPTAVIVTDDFSPIGNPWQPMTGAWTVNNGTYGNSANGDHDITVITAYPGLSPEDPGHTQLEFPDFTVRARVRNQVIPWASSSTTCLAGQSIRRWCSLRPASPS